MNRSNQVSGIVDTMNLLVEPFILFSSRRQENAVLPVWSFSGQTKRTFRSHAARAPLRDGLRRFSGLASSEKSAQLRELASIVLGIRVFNRSIGKGGRRLDDPAPGCLSQASKLREDLVGATRAPRAAFKRRFHTSLSNVALKHMNS